MEIDEEQLRYGTKLMEEALKEIKEYKRFHEIIEKYNRFSRQKGYNKHSKQALDKLYQTAKDDQPLTNFHIVFLLQIAAQILGLADTDDTFLQKLLLAEGYKQDENLVKSYLAKLEKGSKISSDEKKMVKDYLKKWNAFKDFFEALQSLEYQGKLF